MLADVRNNYRRANIVASCVLALSRGIPTDRRKPHRSGGYKRASVYRRVSSRHHQVPKVVHISRVATRIVNYMRNGQLLNRAALDAGIPGKDLKATLFLRMHGLYEGANALPARIKLIYAHCTPPASSSSSSFSSRVRSRNRVNISRAT